MDVNLSELRELVMDREAWRAAIHAVAKSRTQLSNWTELNWWPINNIVTVSGEQRVRTQPYMHPSPPNSPPTQAATWHWAEFPVLPSRSLLVLHVKYSSVSMSIPDSLTIHSPSFPLVTIRLLQRIEQSSLCCPAGPCWFSMLNTAVCPCPFQTP